MNRKLPVILGLLCWVGFLTTSKAQCPAADFSAPATACINQAIPLSNLSGAGNYSWDFCAGDLLNTPAAADLFTHSGSSGRPGLDLVKEGNLWYGFVAGFFTNALYRLRFGNGLNNAPTQVDDLGNIGGMLVNPGQIRIIQEGGLWYGILHNTTPGDLVKITFGNSLTNAPTISPLTSGLAAGFENSGLVVGKDPVNGWVAVISGPGQFKILRLGNGLSSPGPSDMITSGPVASAADLDIINVCGNWYGFAAGNFGNSSVYRLDFGTNLFSAPVITSIASPLPGNNLGRLRILKEADSYFILVTATDLPGNPLIKLSFGNDLTSVPAVATEPNLTSVPGNSYALGCAKENSTWTVLVMSFSTGRTFLVSYPNTCGTATQTSSLANPQVIYNQSGSYKVSLDYVTGSGVSNKTRLINVSSSSAPDIDFATQNFCVNNNVNFSALNTSGNLISYNWNFGDTGTAPIAAPSHAYVSAGVYTVSLTVGASNGCSNFISKSLEIFNGPVADFSLPSASPVCTNQNYQFSNTSTFNAASNPSWEWRVNGALVGTSFNLTQAFGSPAAQEVRLKSLIAGCENEMIKVLPSVVTGPLIDFTASDNCVGTLVPFTNMSMGVVTGYQWAFGDGATSTAVNASHPYSTNGTFQATLTGSNAAGCQNFATRPITIYSVPQPDFTTGLPPFSCAGSPTSFQNNTPPLVDSNLSGWAWQFGDVEGGTSIQQAPLYTYAQSGNFNVTLTATSNKGCSKSFSTNVTISPSPVADFVNGPSCLNLSTQFTDQSSGGGVSRLWQIGPASFTSPNPAYVFASTGNYFVTLSVTGANGCISVKSKTINVPVPPTQNFSAANLCSGKQATFSDVTTSPQDVVIGWNWNFAGNAVSGNPAQFIFNPDGTYNVKMTTTHASGCIYTLSKNVTVNPGPVASFTATPDRGAPPLIVQFVNTSQQASSYAWKFFDKVVSTSAQTSPSHTFTSLGDYSVELTATNVQGCSDVVSTPITVLIPSIDLVMKDFSLVNDPSTGKLKSNVTIQNNSNTPIGSVEVAIFLADKAVVNETVILNLNPGQSASRTLSFTLSPNQFDFTFLCARVLSDKDIHPDDNKRCVEMDNGEYLFGPYPNPSSSSVAVDWIMSKPGQVAIDVYDNMGRKVTAFEVLGQAGLNQASVDAESFSPGQYYITVRTEQHRWTKRFIRQ